MAVPFKSAAQRRMMFANAPALARRFAAETPVGANLPERVPGAHQLKGAQRAKALARLRERYGSNASGKHKRHRQRKAHAGAVGGHQVPPQFQKGGSGASGNAG